MAKKTAKCRKGEIKVSRSGYTRVDGTRVSATTFCAPDRGAPGRGPDIIPTPRPGSLGGPGYTSKSAEARHRILRKHVRDHGYASTIATLQSRINLGHRTMGKKALAVFESDKRWAQRTFSGKSGRNPHDGTHPSIYRVKISANWDPHVIDLAEGASHVDAAMDDLRSGRDASIFGGLSDPYRFRFEAIDKTVYGDVEALERMVEAADMLSSSGLSDAEQKRIWSDALDEGLGEIVESVDEMIEDSEERSENPGRRALRHNPKAVRAASRLARGGR